VPRSDQSSAGLSHPTLTREGEYWTILYEGRVLRLGHSKGLAYIACLLRFPKEEFHVSDLQAAAAGEPTGEPHFSEPSRVSVASNGTEHEARPESAEAVERLRKAVRNRIRASLEKIEQCDPALGRYLANAIRTGTFCSYAPRTRLAMHGAPSSGPQRNQA
jgi:hypothetical protein